MIFLTLSYDIGLQLPGDRVPVTAYMKEICHCLHDEELTLLGPVIACMAVTNHWLRDREMSLLAW